MRAFALLFVSLAAGTALGAEVFRTVDENGVVSFSDRPGQGPSERVVVVTPPANGGRSASAPGAGIADAAQARNDSVPDATGEAAPEQPSAEERSAQRARNCEIATERAERYRNARRLYRELPDGEREYLDDDEIDAAKADAESDLATWCS